MKKRFLIGLIVFLSLSGATFAECCRNSPSGNSNCQKACQNVISLFAIDFSFLSPRATAADVHVCPPKHCCMHQHPCCMPQCPCCEPQPPCCEPACQPQCCPKKSMINEENPQNNIVTVCNKHIPNKSCTTVQTKTSLFRIDLFRIIKLQIL